MRYVEENKIYTIDAKQVNPPNWGLARISQRAKSTDEDYYYSDKAGAGVDAYVIDTGECGLSLVNVNSHCLFN